MSVAWAGPRGLLRRMPPLLWLAGVWTMLWGRWSWGTAVAGVLVACCVTVLLPLPSVVLGGRVRVGGLVRFVVRFLRDLVVASVQVSALALRPGGDLRNAVVAVGLRSRSDLLITITSEALTLVPGSIVIEVDRPRSVIYAHVLGVRGPGDVEAFRASVLDLEDRVVAAFGAPPRRRRPHRGRGTSAGPPAAVTGVQQANVQQSGQANVQQSEQANVQRSEQANPEEAS